MSETQGRGESWVVIGLLHAGALILAAVWSWWRCLHHVDWVCWGRYPTEVWIWHSIGVYMACAIVGLILSSAFVLPRSRRAWPFAWAVITACVAGAALLVLP